MIPKTIRSNPWIQFIGLIVLTLSVIGFIYYIADILVPFLLAFIIAYILDPAVDWMHETFQFKRITSILIILFITILIVAGFGYYLTDQAIQFGQEIRRVIQDPPNLENWIQRYLPQPLKDYLSQLIDTIQSKEFTNRFKDFFWRNLSSVASSLTKGSSVLVLFASRTLGLIGVLINSLVLLFSTIYFLLDFDRIILSMRRLIPHRFRESTDELFGEIDQVLRAFLRGHLIVCVTTGTLYGLGYLLVGLRGGFLIGFITGLFNVVPYLGPLIGFLLAFVMALVQFGFSYWVLGVIAVFVLVQSLEGNILTPNIVGGAVGLNPIAVLFALMVFGKLMGFIGLLLAIPISAILKVVTMKLLEVYRSSEFFRKENY